MVPKNGLTGKAYDGKMKIAGERPMEGGGELR